MAANPQESESKNKQDRLAWAYAMVARGEASWSGGKPVGLAKRVRLRPLKGGKLASDMIIEDRR